MAYSLLKWEVDGNIGLLTINSPTTLNALNSVVLRELGEWVDKEAKDKILKAIVITGGKGWPG